MDELKLLLNYIAKKFMGFELSDAHANEILNVVDNDQVRHQSILVGRLTRATLD